MARTQNRRFNQFDLFERRDADGWELLHVFSSQESAHEYIRGKRLGRVRQGLRSDFRIEPKTHGMEVLLGVYVQDYGRSQEMVVPDDSMIESNKKDLILEDDGYNERKPIATKQPERVVNVVKQPERVVDPEVEMRAMGAEEDVIGI